MQSWSNPILGSAGTRSRSIAPIMHAEVARVEDHTEIVEGEECGGPVRACYSHWKDHDALEKELEMNEGANARVQ
jgi:hypothetical protein